MTQLLITYEIINDFKCKVHICKKSSGEYAFPFTTAISEVLGNQSWRTVIPLFMNFNVLLKFSPRHGLLAGILHWVSID